MAGIVAVVTGSNKGIGFEIVKELLKRGVDHVYLTSRDLNRGKAAIEELNKEGLKPEFHLLDVTDEESVKKLAKDIKEKHGGIDILINNAAIVTADRLKTTYEDSVKVINSNCKSLLTIQKHVYPILKDNARVVFVSSDCAHISNLENKYWIDRLTKKNITVDDIDAFVNWYLDSVKTGTLKESDFEGTQILAYKISKIAAAALSRVQQREIGRGIAINALHPGHVATEMSKNCGIPADEASKPLVWLALDVDQSVKGRYFWYDKTEKDWADHKQKWHNNRPELLEYFKKINFTH